MKYSFCFFVIFLADFFSSRLLSNFGAAGDAELDSNYSGINCGNFSTDRTQKMLEWCFQEVNKRNWTKNESNLHPRFCIQQLNYPPYNPTNPAITWTNNKKYTELAIQISNSSADQSNKIYSLSNSEDYFNLNDVFVQYGTEQSSNGTEYRALILRYSPTGEVFQDDVVELNFTVPEVVVAPNISWSNFTDFFSNDESSTNVTFKINWSNTEVATPCQVEVFLVPERSYDDIEHHLFCDLSAIQECILPNLRYGTTYIMMAKVYGELVINNAKYRVPSCRKIAEMKNTICSKPLKVEEISVDEDTTDISNSSITIMWKYDDIEPDYFNVTITYWRRSKSSNVFYDSKITTGNNSTFKLPYGSEFQGNVTAYKDNISSESTGFYGYQTASPSTTSAGLIYSSPNDSIRSPLFYIVTISIVLALLILLAGSLYLHYKRRADNPEKLKKIYSKVQITNLEPITLNNEIVKTVKELQKLQVVRGRLLGKGNFGVVHLGTLMSNGKKLKDVAIKALRDNATAQDIEQFEKEIELMQNVGFHQNIVSMIGSCPDTRGPLLIVEYCPLGDLHAYLCNIRKRQEKAVVCNPASENQYNNQVPLESENISKRFVENKIYGVTEDIAVPHLTICDLLSFGRQVATGMDYLASNRVIHRDLAARNVLLCNDGTAKISDFGLSKDIYTENIYRKIKGEAMPIKWMAPESLSKGEYSTASDVWSFGVFLWELLTMGDEPYPDTVVTVPDAFLLQLNAGYRMANPCPSYPQLYEIMCNCWREERELRPEFSTIRNLLDEILRGCSPNDYIIITDNGD